MESKIMDSLGIVMTRSAVAIAVAMLLLWVLSLRLRNASIVDPFWGAGYVMVGWLAALGTDGAEPRRTIALALVTLWGLRLSLHLLRRNAGHGEDPRYAAMRRGHGARFWWVSLFTVFLFQGVLMWIVSLPVQAALVAPGPAGLGPLDLVGIAFWGVGFLFEAVGDRQLARFKADPANRGAVMDRGLWRYTRHPNYFGDAAQWWGLGLLALSTGAWWALLSPVVMNVLLLKVSGVAMLEKDIGERRPGYRAYVERTNAFLPWFPKEARP
jgi:steroid 5-alpha reductase family enzyme